MDNFLFWDVRILIKSRQRYKTANLIDLIKKYVSGPFNVLKQYQIQVHLSICAHGQLNIKKTII